MKRLAQIPTGRRVFVDTNIFVLHYNNQGALTTACSNFLVRTANGQLQGFTSVSVVAETVHRIMISEAAFRLGFSSSRKTVEYLQKHPKMVQQLKENLKVASDIYHNLGIDILPVTHKELHSSKRFRAKWGLLTNDSLIVAVMQTHKLRYLASNDAGFARVPDIQVFRPR